MQAYQYDLIRFVIERGILYFGEFTFRSRRISPYFFNADLFGSGLALARLGRSYTRAAIDSGIDFGVPFGPAYRSIPLVTAIVMTLVRQHRRDLPQCFNCREARDCDEGGTLVGVPLSGRVLIIDDVITTGIAIREVMQIIDAQGARAMGVLIALNRRRRGEDELSAVQEVERDLDVSMMGIVPLEQMLKYLAEDIELKKYLPAAEIYHAQYSI